MRITEKPSKSDASSNSHTDDMFTWKWAYLFGMCIVQPQDSGGLLHSSSVQFPCVISVEFVGNSKQLQWPDSVHLSLAYTDYSFCSFVSYFNFFLSFEMQL